MSDVVSEIVNGAPAADESTETPAENTQVDPNQEPAPNPDTKGSEDSKEDPQFSSRFAALSRKEKYLQEQADAFKDKETKYNSYSDLQAKIKENPLAVLEHFGMSLDDIISASLGEDKPAPTTESQIEMLRAEIEGFKTAAVQKETDTLKAEEEAKQDSINEAITVHQLSITNHLSENADKYELINLQGAQDLVWEVTEAHFNANKGEILTPEQASSKVEVYLEEQVRKAMNLKRFGAKEDTETKSSPFEVEQVKPTEPKQQSQTLTSEFVQQSSPSEKPSGLSEDESKKRAASLLKWN